MKPPLQVSYGSFFKMQPVHQASLLIPAAASWTITSTYKGNLQPPATLLAETGHKDKGKYFSL